MPRPQGVIPPSACNPGRATRLPEPRAFSPSHTLDVSKRRASHDGRFDPSPSPPSQEVPAGIILSAAKNISQYEIKYLRAYSPCVGPFRITAWPDDRRSGAQRLGAGQLARPPYMVGGRRELRSVVAGTLDAELFHAVAKGIGMQTENSCRTSQPLNNSTGLVKGG